MDFDIYVQGYAVISNESAELCSYCEQESEERIRDICNKKRLYVEHIK